jgi:hypothetical protein
MNLINPWPHQQTNGKMERPHRRIKDWIWIHGHVDDYIEYGDTCRLHWMLDSGNYGAPMMTVHIKATMDDAREQYSKRVEAYTNVRRAGGGAIPMHCRAAVGRPEGPTGRNAAVRAVRHSIIIYDEYDSV